MDKIEEVARAIAAVDLGSEQGWEEYVGQARAAIEAMRPPSDDFASYVHLAHDIRPQDWSDIIDAALSPSPR